MTADVWEAVIQWWSALQLLIRNSKTGPAWPTDGSHLPPSAVFSSQIFLRPFVLGRRCRPAQHRSYVEKLIVSGRLTDGVILKSSNEAVSLDTLTQTEKLKAKHI